MVTEHQSREVLLSQFPRARGESGTPHGFNRRFDYKQTMADEGRRPSKVLVVNVPNDKGFDAAVKDHTTRTYWDKYPNKPDETHCARAAYDALKAGGVPLEGHDNGQILPKTLGNEVENAMRKQREQRVLGR
ncbi:MAG: hypothetical protein M3119_00885 [Verrucomicrobiota bacterium]|nr:hypothetical protein [Verrucomicrobiota bacterium]